MTKPITPQELAVRKAGLIPDEVIEIFNEEIVLHWDGYCATVMQDEVVSKIVAALEIDRQKIFDNHWLDVEPIFEEAGWEVTYDKPGYCEAYKAYFEFRIK